MEKLLKQTGICVIILLSILVLESLNSKPVDKVLAVCAKQIAKDYTLEEIKTFGQKAVETVQGASSVVVNAVISPASDEYSEPIDERRTDAVSSVYAVSGGTVVSVGENNELGKYIKIVHGDAAESTYGQCAKIYVQPLERVKKGQIIAEYQNQNEEDFYYVLSYLK